MRRPLILLLLAACSAQSPAPPPAWGLYQIHWGRRFPAALDAELEKFASKPAYVMFYRDLARPYPRPGIDAIRSHGATPIISLELWHWHQGRRDRSLGKIADGGFDDHFRAWARAAKEDGKPVLLRFGFEMNGDWFTWSGNPERFVEAWRRIHGLFREEGARNVAWVWCPNIVSVPDTPENGMHRYYPGDAHVDWVALDGYNFGDDHDGWHGWQSFEEVFDDALRDFATRYRGKPLMIAETGSAPGPRRAAWIRDAWRYLRGRPAVKAVIWFHLDKRPKEPDWRLDVTPESLRAFNETFAARRR